MDQLNSLLKRYDSLSFFNTITFQVKTYQAILDTSPTKSIESELKRLMFDLLAWKLTAQLGYDIVLTTENSEMLAEKSMSTLWFGRSELIGLF
jgi:hypothetical protein